MVLPWSSPVFPVFLLTQNDKQYLLTAYAESGEETADTLLPARSFSIEDLQQKDAWQVLFRFHPPHKTLLAQFSARNHLQIEPTVFLEALGIHPSAGNLEEFLERGRLSDDAVDFSLRLDLPLSVLRLWERLPPEDKNFWKDFEKRYGVKRNLFREMIQDFYELSPPVRKKAKEQIESLAARLDTGKSKFPADRIRDELHRIRFPLIEENRRELLEIKKNLKTGAGLDLEIPPDLEGDGADFRCKVRTDNELENLVSKLQRPETATLIRRAIELLS